MINENLKGQSINDYEDEEEDQKINRENISNEKENDNYIEIENNLINQMKLEIEQLKETLIQNNEKINDLIQENNKFKLLQVDNNKKLAVKDSIIDSNKQEINRLLSKKNALEIEDETNKKIIKELNYKIIELNQKIESNETMNKIYQKIKEKKPDNIENKYLIQINEFVNKINEIEIKNSKLEFDNKHLTNKINIINNSKKNELEIMEVLYRKKYENFEKSIERLNEMINELLNEKKREPIEYNYSNIQNDIYKHFSVLDEKIKKLDNNNFLLKKENQKIKSENEELNIIINGKETIIEKLQSNINKIENDFKIKLAEINPSNIKSPINNNENIFEKNNYNNENIEHLLNEQKRLIEENEILKNNFEQINQDINEANELFVNKQKEYEKTIKNQTEKLKEYKFKISILKIKINELHSEIEFLQEKQIKSPEIFFKGDNNILSTIEKERNSLNLNFTPDQMKLIGGDKTPSINPKM